MPTIITTLLNNTFNSNCAPLSTKNNANNGVVHFFVRDIKSFASGLQLQKTTPSIMHVKSVENEIFISPSIKDIIDKATVKATNEIIKESRFAFEKNIFSSFPKIHPSNAPNISDITISINGSIKD